VFCIAQEFEKHRRRAAALKAVAEDVRSKSHVFGQRGPRLLDPTERAERQRTIEEYADQVNSLADRAAEGQPTTYRQFSAILAELSNLGFSPPPPSLVSEVARSHIERRERIRILLVRAGSHEEPVTKVIESDESQVKKLVAGRRLKHLGARLPVIGQSSPLGSYKGPEHVVLELPPGTNIPGAQESGLYLVIDLAAARVSRLQ
jgi:hypothetical protein